MTERELTRNAARRLAIIRHAQEVTRNVAQTCRYFGIARQSYYVWLRRYELLGPEGLRDRSRRPLVSPNATKAAVIDRIIYLRQNYHFGPQKISMYLKRYQEITVTPCGVWRILRRLDLSRLPTSQRYKRHKERWKRYEKQLPGHSVQIDVKFIDPIRGVRAKHYQFTAIDDCTRLRDLSEAAVKAVVDALSAESSSPLPNPWSGCARLRRTTTEAPPGHIIRISDAEPLRGGYGT